MTVWRAKADNTVEELEGLWRARADGSVEELDKIWRAKADGSVELVYSKDAEARTHEHEATEALRVTGRVLDVADPAYSANETLRLTGRELDVQGPGTNREHSAKETLRVGGRTLLSEYEYSAKETLRIGGRTLFANYEYSANETLRVLGRRLFVSSDHRANEILRVTGRGLGVSAAKEHSAKETLRVTGRTLFISVDPRDFTVGMGRYSSYCFQVRNAFLVRVVKLSGPTWLRGGRLAHDYGFITMDKPPATGSFPYSFRYEAQSGPDITVSGTVTVVSTLDQRVIVPDLDAVAGDTAGAIGCTEWRDLPHVSKGWNVTKVSGPSWMYVFNVGTLWALPAFTTPNGVYPYTVRVQEVDQTASYTASGNITVTGSQPCHGSGVSISGAAPFTFSTADLTFQELQLTPATTGAATLEGMSATVNNNVVTARITNAGLLTVTPTPPPEGWTSDQSAIVTVTATARCTAGGLSIPYTRSVPIAVTITTTDPCSGAGVTLNPQTAAVSFTHPNTDPKPVDLTASVQGEATLGSVTVQTLSDTTYLKQPTINSSGRVTIQPQSTAPSSKQTITFNVTATATCGGNSYSDTTPITVTINPAPPNPCAGAGISNVAVSPSSLSFQHPARPSTEVTVTPVLTGLAGGVGVSATADSAISSYVTVSAVQSAPNPGSYRFTVRPTTTQPPTQTPVSGNVTVRVTASCGGQAVSPFAVQLPVTVRRAAPNNAPTIHSVTPSSLSIAANGSDTFTVEASDPDAGDTVTIEAASSATGVATVAGGNYGTAPLGRRTRTFTVSGVAAGTATITVTASDGTANVTSPVAVTVTASDPCANATVQSSSFEGGSPVTFNYQHGQTPDPVRVYLTASAENGATISSVTAAKVGTHTLFEVSAATPTSSSRGTHYVDVTPSSTPPGDNTFGLFSVTVEGTCGGTAVTPKVLSKRVDLNAPPNRPPTLTVPSSFSLKADETKSFTITTSDPDGNPVTVTATDNSNLIDIGTVTNSSVQVVGQNKGTGTATVTVTASDTRGGSTSRPVTVTVTAAVDPCEGKRVRVTHTATSPYSISYPNPQTRRAYFSVTPDSGVTLGTIIAAENPDTYFAVGSVVTTDNPSLGTHYVVISGRQAPAEGATETGSVDITAPGTCGGNAVPDGTLSIPVEVHGPPPPPANMPPVMAPIDNQSVDENSTENVVVSAHDPNTADSISFTVSVVSGGTFVTAVLQGSPSKIPRPGKPNNWEQTLRLTGRNAGMGTAEIRVTASDGTATDSETFSVTVNPVIVDPCANATLSAASTNLTAEQGATASTTLSTSGFPSGTESWGLGWVVGTDPDGLTITRSGNTLTVGSTPEKAAGTYQWRVQYSRGGCTRTVTGNLVVTAVMDPGP